MKNKKSGVCQINCEGCDAFLYIGQTVRNVKSNINEFFRNVENMKSDFLLANHILVNNHKQTINNQMFKYYISLKIARNSMNKQSHYTKTNCCKFTKLN